MDFASTPRSIVYGIFSGSTIEFPGNCDPAIVWKIPPLKAGCGVKGSNKSFIFKNMTPELEALINFYTNKVVVVDISANILLIPLALVDTLIRYW